MSERQSRGARTLAKGLGTGLLVAVVVGSGIAAERLSPGDVGLQLLENSTATVLALAALILAFGPVSGAHFNPAVTLAELATGKLDRRLAARYIAAQIAGGCAGSVIANLMYELPAVELATHDRITAATFLAEVVATFGDRRRLTSTFSVETMGLEPTTPCLQSRTEVVRPVVLGTGTAALMPSRVEAFPQVSRGSGVRRVLTHPVWSYAVPPRLDPLATSPLATFAATSAPFERSQRVRGACEGPGRGTSTLAPTRLWRAA